VLAVARDRALDAGAMLVGPRHTGAKLIGILAILALVVAALPLWPLRVSAKVDISPAAARNIPAPFAGYLKSVSAKPGEAVRAGQVLASMDTSDLEMERAEITARRASLATELDDAQSRGDLGKAATLRPQVAEADARLAFIEDHIRRADITSPVTGTVSRGDLESFIGARVEPTQMLFEVVTQENVATVKVDERDIRLVRPGQRGALTVAALPGQPVNIVVERVNPAAEAVQGANVYMVEARIEDPPAWLKPGQSGRAKLDVARDDGTPRRTSGLDMLLGPLVDEARMRWWW
jgi:multidrug resistance efflux pump